MEETLVITNQRGVDVTTSILVAKVFEKTHAHVLRDIRELSCSKEFHESNFGEMFDIKQLPNGGSRRDTYYEITKDGFSFLVMGYTGEKASQFKETFIYEFNKREALLKNDDYIISRAIQITQKRLEIAENTIRQQKNYIEALKPQAQIAVQFVLADGLDSIATVAKIMGYGRNEFFQMLRDNKILQEKGSQRNLPYSKYVTAGYFLVRKSLLNDGQKTVAQTFVTARGKVWLQRNVKTGQPQLALNM